MTVRWGIRLRPAPHQAGPNHRQIAAVLEGIREISKPLVNRLMRQPAEAIHPIAHPTMDLSSMAKRLRTLTGAEALNLVAWDGIEPSTRGFSIPATSRESALIDIHVGTKFFVFKR